MTPIFTHGVEVRFRDCDPLGHVNNAVYLTYLEQARFHHWRAIGLAGQALASASPPDGAAVDVPGVILARAEIDYRRPARYGDVLRVHLAIAALGRTSITYEYEIVDAAGEVIANARTVIVRFDYAVGRPVPVTDDLKAALTRSLI